ncbi:MAG: yocK [Chlamydiales bacterium]|jgi:DnaK suppressor protein|nr:yocK [Chlamydiales bacterium]
MPLTKAQIEDFKEKLLQLRDEITKVLKGTPADIRKSHEDAAAYTQVQRDQDAHDFDQDLNLQLTTQEYDLLKKIDRALQKIEENTYGICDVSEKEIPLKRLEAIPYANMTVDAQAKLEKGLI